MYPSYSCHNLISLIVNAHSLCSDSRCTGEAIDDQAFTGETFVHSPFPSITFSPGVFSFSSLAIFGQNLR